MAALRMFLIVVWVLSWSAVAWPLARLSPKHADRRIMAMMQHCFGGVLAIAGVRLKRVGALSSARPLLLVTNHTSYMDIPILGACAAVHFTPKAEVGHWPLVGMCARLLRCVFIDRRMSQTAENSERLRHALEQGAVISLFPEGTTNDGKRLNAFRSSYFSLAEMRFNGAPLTVQPAAIAYTHINGLPIDTAQWPMIAWYGDMGMLSHARTLLSLGAINASMVFGAALSVDDIDPAQPSSRKALAAHCEREVRHLLQSA